MYLTNGQWPMTIQIPAWHSHHGAPVLTGWSAELGGNKTWTYVYCVSTINCPHPAGRGKLGSAQWEEELVAFNILGTLPHVVFVCLQAIARASQKALINPQCNGNFPRIDQFNCSRSLLRLSHIEDCPILLRYHILILEYCYYCSCSVTEKQDLIIDHKDYALSCISRAEGVGIPIALEFWWPFYSSSFPVDREGLAVLNPILPCKWWYNVVCTTYYAAYLAQPISCSSTIAGVR